MPYPYRYKHAKLAYTAGIIDGEGSIMIISSGKRRKMLGNTYELKVAVTNTNEWLIHWLRFNYGGYVIERRKWQPLQRQRTFDWIICNKKAGEFLKIIEPYLMMKKLQAEIALRFQNRKRRGGRKSAQEYAVEEAEQILMKKANRTGKDALPV